MTEQVNTSEMAQKIEKNSSIDFLSFDNEVTVENDGVIIRLLIAVIFFLVAVFFLEGDFYNIAMAVSYMLSGYDIIIDAYESIIKFKLNRGSVLISLATLPCFYIDKGFDAVIVIWLYRLCQYFCRTFITGIKNKINLNSTPVKYAAHWSKDGQIMNIGNDKITEGMLLQVNNNERIPVDCVITEGETIISVRSLNNKKKPVEVHVGDVLTGGSVNVGNTITVKAIRTLEESTISRINEVVSECKMSHSKAEEILHKFNKFFAPTVVIVAIGYSILGPTAMNTTYQQSIFASCCLLAISYPLALLLSIPLAFYCGTSKAATNGVLVKGARYLELLNEFDYLVIDKNDTLKKDKYIVREIKTQMDENEFMTIVTAIESYSDHELARAIVRSQNINYDPSKVHNFTVEPGLGVSARYGRKQYHIGNLRYMKQLKVKNLDESLENAVYVCDRENYLGAVLFEDNSQEEAVKHINDLKKQEVNNIALFGADSQEELENYKKVYNLSAVFGEMSQQDKIDKIVLFERQGRDVAYVGESEKDKPILDTATLGISMGVKNSASAFANSNVILMYESLEGLVKGRKIARRTCRNVTWTILLCVFIKIVLIVLGFIEMIPLWLIYCIDAIVTVLAVLNASKLK